MTLPGRGLGIVVLTNVSTLIGLPTGHRVADGIAAGASGLPPPESPGLPLTWILTAITTQSGSVRVYALP